MQRRVRILRPMLATSRSRQDVSLVMDVDQRLARALNEIGVTSAQQLLASFDEKRLSEFKRPWGKGFQKVGKKAGKILMYAEVLCSGKERILSPADIPAHENYVMFDLEGMPPYLDELEKIYLWGMQVYGKRPSAFVGVTAGFGADGDREGWEAFLTAAKKLFDEYGDIPFVHWHHYERVPHRAVRGSLRRPRWYRCSRADQPSRPVADHEERDCSSSAKLQPEGRGRDTSGSSARRTSTAEAGRWLNSFSQPRREDEAERNQRMGEILKYNEEDLAATWAVFEWLRGKASAAVIPYLAASASDKTPGSRN